MIKSPRKFSQGKLILVPKPSQGFLLGFMSASTCWNSCQVSLSYFLSSQKTSVIFHHWSFAVYHRHPGACWLWTGVIQRFVISCTAKTRTHKHRHCRTVIKPLSISREERLTPVMPTISLHYSPKIKPYLLWVNCHWTSTHLSHIQREKEWSRNSPVRLIRGLSLSGMFSFHSHVSLWLQCSD